ncbi:HPr family phosphocarrier protein [Acidisphaera sp. L21]|uniref:HPr family phosphocarrier protein n=1 Tax=Acidisphaera sp. L21 TaxID=1641851 RepID=UPI00131BF827|nr:HPr family phosphocarrier protein [Acidisphaera sp. L21]
MDAPAEPELVAQATICNRRGLHARAAAKFVSMAEQYTAVIEVAAHGQSVSAQSIMGLMMLGAGKGTTLDLQATGADAAAALAALVGLVEAGFYEQD